MGRQTAAEVRELCAVLEGDGEHHRVCFNGAPRDGLAWVTSQQSLGEAEGAECGVAQAKGPAAVKPLLAGAVSLGWRNSKEPCVPTEH